MNDRNFLFTRSPVYPFTCSPVYLFTCCLTILLAFAGCGKNDKDQTEERFIDSRLAADQFKAGSYWVYQNDSTYETDCTYVSNSNPGSYMDCRPHSPCYKVHFFDIVYRHSTAEKGDDFDWDRIEWNRIMRNPVPVYYSVFNGPAIYSPCCWNIDSLQIGQFTFHEIYKSSIDSIDYYYVGGTGIIRKVIYKTVKQGSWSVVRWKIAY